MPSDFLTPFLELDQEFVKSFGVDLMEAAAGLQPARGFQRRHSLCPVTLPNSKFNDGESPRWGWGPDDGPQWKRDGQLPRSALSHIPFRMDRSVSMIEGAFAEVPPLPPPPGLRLLTPPLSPPSPHMSTRYKTELCRTFEESGTCKYGAKCQFAHGEDELRGLSRHPKYKTEPCRTFHTIGFCPYGARCHFIHNADEMLQAPPPQRSKLRPPPLRHSLSFAGFSSSSPARAFRPVDSSRTSSLLFGRSSSVSPSPCSSESPDLSPLFPEVGQLRPCPRHFAATNQDSDSALGFFAAAAAESPALAYQTPGRASLLGLQRCSSADSLSEEGYASSCSLSSASSGTESPGCEGRRLPIFSRLSITDE
ncbi:mRNA decay activator protein ZFP36L1 [Nerophis lumbriciformis]|uniref:mRNA decay activator protein ZFP36L1 n=1 Tax=Nerophis lumbriciformis TaxID=546530 RepID=UPI002ADF86FE|nr:mRNA decay activator protein ZFP36L1-like [Nerophis lumbriciformis]